MIDTPPELRLQLLAAGVSSVDAVLFTHEHADHIHGIDDIRAFTLQEGTRLPMYGSEYTLNTLSSRFPYIMDENLRALPGTYKPQGRAMLATPGVPVTIRDMTALPIEVPHGRVNVLAWRVGPIGYMTDAKSVSTQAIAALKGVKVLVINALFRTPHPTHLSLPEALGIATAVGAERTFLTHLTHDNFHAALEAELPVGVAPAYDGLTLHVDEA